MGTVKYKAFTPSWEAYLGCGISFQTNLGRDITDFLGTEYNPATEIIPGEQCGAEQTFAASSGQAVVLLGTTTAPINSDGVRKVSVSSVVAELLNYICEDCPSGTYKATTGTGSCTACPTDKTSSTGSSASSDCACHAGYTPDAVTAQCTACPAGTYKEAPPSNNPCSVCPKGVGQTSPAASVSPSQCVCQSGYGGAACSVCDAGKYKPMLGDQECYPCVSGRTSPAGSADQNACACKSGYNSITGIPTCLKCPVKIKSFYAQYLYRVVFESQSDPDGVGGAGGSPHEFTINSGEYIMSMSYQEFIADWQTYLGCRYLGGAPAGDPSLFFLLL